MKRERETEFSRIRTLRVRFYIPRQQEVRIGFVFSESVRREKRCGGNLMNDGDSNLPCAV